MIYKEELAAFMLHQATEATYRTTILALEGFEKKSHSIRQLKKYCKRCAPQLNDLFPADNWQEERLLKLLEEAYLDTRYRNNYEITQRELKLLYSRAERLQEVAGEVFEERMDTCWLV